MGVFCLNVRWEAATPRDSAGPLLFTINNKPFWTTRNHSDKSGTRISWLGKVVYVSRKLLLFSDGFFWSLYALFGVDRTEFTLLRCPLVEKNPTVTDRLCFIFWPDYG
jgi:hypothetical protein